MTGPAPPAIMLATADDESASGLDDELRRRYGADYEVITCVRYEHARAILEGLRRWSRPVAMILACYNPRDREGLMFLRRANALHPAAKRAVVVNWGDFDSGAAVFEAIGDGHAEVLLLRPERRRDEEFHGAVTDVLDDWHLANGSGFEAVRLIGTTEERTHVLRDNFGRNHIPIGYVDARSDAGRQALASLGLGDDAALPVVALQCTSPPTILQNPTDIEIADAFGVMSPSSGDTRFDVVIVGAGPSGLAALVHLEAFHLDASLELRTRAITWGWIAVYAVVPLAMLVALARQAGVLGGGAVSGPVPRTVRVLLAVQAAILLGFGAAPTWADGAWPWALTPLTGRAVGAWLLGLGVASGHALLAAAPPRCT